MAAEGAERGDRGPTSSHGAMVSAVPVCVRVVIVLSVLAALPACVTTNAWERERLAKPTMDLDRGGPRRALTHHVLSTREGAVGGFGGGGGGCGCN